MLSLLIILNNPVGSQLQSLMKPLVPGDIGLVSGFADGLGEILDNTPAVVIIQDKIFGVTCEPIVRRVRQMLGDSSPVFILAYEEHTHVTPLPGLLDITVDLNRSPEALVDEMGSNLKRIFDGEQVLPTPLLAQPAATPPIIPAANSGTKRYPRPPRVLLVEDNFINQKVTLTMLNNLECRVDLAPNGQKAIEALEQVEYDLVLMDWMMPRMDGLEATTLIRSSGSKVIDRNVMIVAQTSNTKPGDREKCIEAGMDGYLAKPVQIGRAHV